MFFFTFGPLHLSPTRPQIYPFAPSQIVLLVKYGCKQGEGLEFGWFEPCVLFENMLGRKEWNGAV